MENNPNIKVIHTIVPNFEVTQTVVVLGEKVQEAINKANPPYFKISAIKILRDSVPGLGLKNAKDIIDYVLAQK